MFQLLMGAFVFCVPAQLTAQEGVKLEENNSYQLVSFAVGWVADFNVGADGDTIFVTNYNEEEEQHAPEYGEWTWDDVAKAYKRGTKTLKFYSDGSYDYPGGEGGGEYTVPE